MNSSTPLDAAKISMAHASQYRRKETVLALQLTEVVTLRLDAERSQIGMPGAWLVQSSAGRVILTEPEFEALFVPHIVIEKIDHAATKPRSPEHREP